MGRKKKLTDIEIGCLYRTEKRKYEKDIHTVFVVSLHEAFSTEAYIFPEQVEYYMLENPERTYHANLGYAQYSWTKL